MSDMPVTADTEGSASDVDGQMVSLSDGEQLVIRAIRRWIQCLRQQTPQGLHIMRADLVDALGREDGEAAVGMITRLSHVINLFAIGPIAIHWPCCINVSRDECAIAAAIGACQLGDYVGARDIALHCLNKEGVPPLLDVICPLASLLRRNAILLPQAADGGQRAPSGFSYLRPDGATVH